MVLRLRAPFQVLLATGFVNQSRDGLVIHAAKAQLKGSVRYANILMFQPQPADIAVSSVYS